MSGNAAARKLLANAARRCCQPTVRTVSKTATIKNGNKAVTPTQRFFSSPPPTATAPKSGGNTTGGGASLPKEGTTTTKAAGAAGEIGPDPSKFSHHPYHHWHHRHRRFTFGKFVALGTFGFISYRAMVGPPILLQYHDDDEEEDPSSYSSSRRKERRWRCHAKGSSKNKDVVTEEEKDKTENMDMDVIPNVVNPTALDK